MADHGAHLAELPIEGERVEVSKFSKIILIAAMTGGCGILASLGIFLFGGELAKSFAYSWLFACFYLSSILPQHSLQWYY